MTLWITVILSSLVFAQDNKSIPAKLGTSDLRVAVDLVLLDVSVSDKSGKFVNNLRQDNFKIYEDKVEQQISYFSTEESPVTWGLVVDRSGSMSDMKDVYDAALHMMNEGTTEDEMFVMTFSRNIDSLSELTLDRRALQNAMFGLHAQGATALWDAVNSGIDYVKRGKHRRKALLVITDGLDNKSVLSFKRVLDRVRESDLTIYTVGINTPTGVFAKGRDERGQLEQLAEITGGFAHFPTDIEKCRETMAEIAREVSEHYTIGYYPVNANYDGKWRKIRAAVTDSDHPSSRYVARTRAGYYAMGSLEGPDGRAK
jgi:Ca-activated chloride channel family protein